jgi:hypothetical protein
VPLEPTYRQRLPNEFSKRLSAARSIVSNGSFSNAAIRVFRIPATAAKAAVRSSAVPSR